MSIAAEDNLKMIKESEKWKDTSDFYHEGESVGIGDPKKGTICLDNNSIQISRVFVWA